VKGEGESEEDGNSDHVVIVCHCIQCVDTLLCYVDQSGFEDSDNTATRKIQTVMKRSQNNSLSTYMSFVYQCVKRV
jgi:hypothetical protein